jgi:hypothetical protein
MWNVFGNGERKIPGYWKRSKSKIALQDPLNGEHAENTAKNQQNNANALQDFLMAQSSCYDWINRQFYWITVTR